MLTNWIIQAAHTVALAIASHVGAPPPSPPPPPPPAAVRTAAPQAAVTHQTAVRTAAPAPEANPVPTVAGPQTPPVYTPPTVPMCAVEASDPAGDPPIGFSQPCSDDAAWLAGQGPGWTATFTPIAPGTDVANGGVSPYSGSPTNPDPDAGPGPNNGASGQ